MNRYAPILKEKTRYWRVPDYGDLQLLHATFIEHVFARHFHEEYVVGVIERGTYRFYWRGEMRYIGEQQLVLINPYEIHSGKPVDESGWTYRTLYPSITLMRQIAYEMTGKDWEMPHFSQAVVTDPLLARQLSQLHRRLDASTSKLERDTLLRTTLGSLIARHATDKFPLQQLYAEKQAVRRVRDYLEAHCDQNPSLEDLANFVGFSPFYLARVFKQEMGCPPHAYLNAVRINRAKELLRFQSISDVAYATGFTDQSHLTRWFKRIVGVTPGHYASSL